MIGLIGRINDNRITFNKEIIDIIIKNNYIPLGIITNVNNDSKLELEKLKPIIDLCNGFILQGGDEYYDIDLLITKYLYDNNIPTLGICLGMQIMGVLNSGFLIDIDNHLNTKHKIKIKKISKLYEIIKKEEIIVNSRHKSILSNTNLDISTIDIIEAIEDKNKRFFIGVQWHPESLLDENSNLLFKSFFDSIK